MALKIRLARGGAKKRPFYRIVVADARAPRDGRYLEKLGTYDPMLAKDSENRIVLNADRIKHWLSVGALPTDRVARFLGKSNIMPMPVIRETPKKSAPKAKAVARAAEREEKVKAAEEARIQAAAEAKAAKEAPVVEAPVVEETPVEAVVEETPVEAVAEASAEAVAETPAE